MLRKPSSRWPASPQHVVFFLDLIAWLVPDVPAALVPKVERPHCPAQQALGDNIGPRFGCHGPRARPHPSLHPRPAPSGSSALSCLAPLVWPRPEGGFARFPLIATGPALTKPRPPKLPLHYPLSIILCSFQPAHPEQARLSVRCGRGVAPEPRMQGGVGPCCPSRTLGPPRCLSMGILCFRLGVLAVPWPAVPRSVSELGPLALHRLLLPMLRL